MEQTNKLPKLGCEKEKQLRSIEGATTTSINFVNKTSAGVKVYWINYQGERQWYKDLKAGESYVQSTYVTHPWVVTDENGGCLGIFEPERDQKDAIIEGSTTGLPTPGEYPDKAPSAANINELLNKPLLIENQETTRYLFSDGAPIKGNRGDEKGWLASSGFESPKVVGADANYYNRAVWKIIPNGDSFFIENQETKRYLFSDGDPIKGNRGEEKGWLVSSGFESPKVVGADANYYNRALWKIIPSGDSFLIENQETRRYLFSDGAPIKGNRGEEKGWLASSGFESPKVVGADANYYNRALWKITVVTTDTTGTTGNYVSNDRLSGQFSVPANLEPGVDLTNKTNQTVTITVSTEGTWNVSSDLKNLDADGAPSAYLPYLMDSLKYLKYPDKKPFSLLAVNKGSNPPIVSQVGKQSEFTLAPGATISFLNNEIDTKYQPDVYNDNSGSITVRWSVNSTTTVIP